METRCLICESTVVISKEQVQACVLLVGTVGSFLLGFVEARGRLHTSPENNAGITLQDGLNLIADCVHAATSDCAESWELAQDVQRYHFGEFDCSCLRCGARFDQETSDALNLQPSDPPVVPPCPGSAGDQRAPR